MPLSPLLFPTDTYIRIVINEVWRPNGNTPPFGHRITTLPFRRFVTAGLPLPLNLPLLLAAWRSYVGTSNPSAFTEYLRGTYIWPSSITDLNPLANPITSGGSAADINNTDQGCHATRIIAIAAQQPPLPPSSTEGYPSWPMLSKCFPGDITPGDFNPTAKLHVVCRMCMSIPITSAVGETWVPWITTPRSGPAAAVKAYRIPAITGSRRVQSFKDTAAPLSFPLGSVAPVPFTPDPLWFRAENYYY